MAREEIAEWFQEEIVSLRSGRVSSEMVDKIQVEHYGSRTPLNGLAGISNVDARTLVITPWDPGAKEAIAKSLTQEDLGASPAIDGEVIRMSWPGLTEETRKQTVKLIHNKSEEARVKLRQARDEAVKGIKEEKDAGDVTEDDFYDGREKLDKLIDEANKELEEMVRKKEEEVVTI